MSQARPIPDGHPMAVIHAYRLLACKLDAHHPILLKDTFHPSKDPEKNFQDTLLTAARNLGSLLCDGIDAILIQGEQTGPVTPTRLQHSQTQAHVSSKLTTSAHPVVAHSSAYKKPRKKSVPHRSPQRRTYRRHGLYSNGPGEMADADFGYVGGAPNKINLYINKTPVKFNIPEDEAVDRLIDLIKENGKWIDPPTTVAEI